MGMVIMALPYTVVLGGMGYIGELFALIKMTF